MKKIELFKPCANDYVAELNKLKVGNHIFEISKRWIHNRGRHFSYINIICSRCFLKSSLSITDNIDKLIERRFTILTDKGKANAHLIKISLFKFANEQCFTDAVSEMNCEDMIIKGIIE